MASSSYSSSTIIAIFVFFHLFPTNAVVVGNNTLRPVEELLKMKKVQAHLLRLNKPALKSIQTSDGDIIDCVLSHLQPAFDHPNLKGQKPMEPPEKIPSSALDRYHHYTATTSASSNTTEIMMFLQSWRSSGESCPEGTVPVRRTTEADLLRASSIRRYGRKPVRRDSFVGTHEVIKFLIIYSPHRIQVVCSFISRFSTHAACSWIYDG